MWMSSFIISRLENLKVHKNRLTFFTLKHPMFMFLTQLFTKFPTSKAVTTNYLFCFLKKGIRVDQPMNSVHFETASSIWIYGMKLK